MFKLDFESIGQSIKNNKNKLIVIGLAILLGVGVLLFTENKISNWMFNRSVKKDLNAIKQTGEEIKDLTNQIEDLKQQRAEKIGEYKEATNILVNASVADNTARSDIAPAAAEVAQAQANLANVVNSNSNVNATVDDINRKLDKLGIK